MMTASSCLLVATTALLVLLPSANAFRPAAMSSRSSSLVCHAEKQQRETTTSSLSRGDVLLNTGLASLLGGMALSSAFPMSAALAADAAEQSYFDDKYKVSFEHIPGNWLRTDTTIGQNNLDSRRITVFKDPNSEANVFVAYTPVQPDFTTLGAFGSILDVAKTIVPKGRGVQSKLISYSTMPKNGAYFYDYVIQPDNQPRRHLTTIFSLVTISGVGECLATYTTSCLESQWEELEPVYKKITDSFQFTKAS